MAPPGGAGSSRCTFTAVPIALSDRLASAVTATTSNLGARCELQFSAVDTGAFNPLQHVRSPFAASHGTALPSQQLLNMPLPLPHEPPMPVSVSLDGGDVPARKSESLWRLCS